MEAKVPAMEYVRQTKKSKQYHYKRRVPSDVAPKFGREWIEESLRTSDAREAKKRATMKSAELEMQWEALRGNLTPFQKWRTGTTWLAEQQPLRLEPNDEEREAREDPPDSDFASANLELLAEGRGQIPPGATQEAFVAYLQGKKKLAKPRISFTEAFKLWTKERKPTNSAERGAGRVVGQFVAMVGDTPLDTVTRDQARRYRDALVKAGTAPGSIETYIAYLRAVYDTAIAEGLIEDRVNPFSKLKIERDRTKEEAREPIPRTDCLGILAQSLADGFDQSDWFAAVLLTSGVRPAAAFRAKLVLNAQVPYWEVPREKLSRPRRIPVHPRLIGKTPARYTIRVEQLRRNFIERHEPYVPYACRHSWKDEAVRVGMPLELRAKIMGHSLRRDIGAHAIYGSSQADLEEARKWLVKMWR
jgi:hypothetical protein